MWVAYLLTANNGIQAHSWLSRTRHDGNCSWRSHPAFDRSCSLGAGGIMGSGAALDKDFQEQSLDFLRPADR
jgi:hypothetical protein